MHPGGLIFVCHPEQGVGDAQAVFCTHAEEEKAVVIGLITVFDAILTGRQSGQKLQCLYGNPIANNFFQN